MHASGITCHVGVGVWVWVGGWVLGCGRGEGGVGVGRSGKGVGVGEREREREKGGFLTPLHRVVRTNTQFSGQLEGRERMNERKKEKKEQKKSDSLCFFERSQSVGRSQGGQTAGVTEVEGWGHVRGAHSGTGDARGGGTPHNWPQRACQVRANFARTSGMCCHSMGGPV